MKFNDERPGISIVLKDKNKKYIYKVPYRPNFIKRSFGNLEYVSLKVCKDLKEDI